MLLKLYLISGKLGRTINSLAFCEPSIQSRCVFSRTDRKGHELLRIVPRNKFVNVSDNYCLVTFEASNDKRGEISVQKQLTDRHQPNRQTTEHNSKRQQRQTASIYLCDVSPNRKYPTVLGWTGCDIVRIVKWSYKGHSEVLKWHTEWVG